MYPVILGSGAASARNSLRPVPVWAVAVPVKPQEVVGHVKTHGMPEQTAEAAEFVALKAISARREAQMQELEAELRRKDSALNARDEEIAMLKRRCEELQHHVCCAIPLESAASLGLEVVKLADDGPDSRLGARAFSRTWCGLSREDIGVPQQKAAPGTSKDETCLPGYSCLVSQPSTSRSIAWSDLEEELVPQTAQADGRGTADGVDAKIREYFARFPDFKLPVVRRYDVTRPGSYYFGEPVCQSASVQLTRSGRAVLKVRGKFRSLESFFDEVRGATRATSSVTPRSSLASARSASQRARSRA